MEKLSIILKNGIEFRKLIMLILRIWKKGEAVFMEQEAQSMKGYHFYAMLSRMKYINRWGLMRNTREENICEHSLEVAMIAHSLAVLKNQRFGGRVNPERAALLGMFHDAAEIITGDLPTPVKYFNSEIRAAYQEVENMAKDRLLSMLPEDLRQVYEPLLAPGEEEKRKFCVW